MGKNNQEKLHTLIYGYKQTGDAATVNQIVLETDKYVWSVVHKVAAPRVSNEDKQDLFQAGRIGVWKALQQFNVHNKNSFLTYAHFKILREITRQLNEGFHLISIPYNNVADIKAFIQHTDEFLSASNMTQSHKGYMMQAMNLKEHKYWRLFEAVSLSSVGSLDVAIADDEEDAPTLLDKVQDTTLFSQPEQSAIESEQSALLQQITSSLSRAEHTVVMKRLSDKKAKLNREEKQTLASLQAKVRKIIG
jgi:RNA polymerase sigma factor (sigma-70 family)